MTDWQPIETAPKDREILLAFRISSDSIMSYVDRGKWNYDDCSRKPKPYWDTAIGKIFGRAWSRNAQYLGWLPLPEPPKEPVR